MPLGGLNSNDLRSGGLDEDLFNQLRAKQLQSQLMQTQQAAAMMGASGNNLYYFRHVYLNILKDFTINWVVLDMDRT